MTHRYLMSETLGHFSPKCWALSVYQGGHRLFGRELLSPVNHPLSCIPFRSLSSFPSSRQQERQAERAARQARREAAAKKKAEVEAYIGLVNSKHMDGRIGSNREKKIKEELVKAKRRAETKELHDERRTKLLKEAGSLTKSLFKTCMLSIKTIKPGNDHDEKEFQEREDAQRRSMETSLSSGEFFSMSPPVDRENELSSRAAYYYNWTRENFDQESDCLRHNPWREACVDRYFHFLRYGESRRKFLLNDYKFEDPYPNRFDSDQVSRFEDQVRELLRDIDKNDSNGSDNENN